MIVQIIILCFETLVFTSDDVRARFVEWRKLSVSTFLFLGRSFRIDQTPPFWESEFNKEYGLHRSSALHCFALPLLVILHRRRLTLRPSFSASAASRCRAASPKFLALVRSSLENRLQKKKKERKQRKIRRLSRSSLFPRGCIGGCRRNSKRASPEIGVREQLALIERKESGYFDRSCSREDSRGLVHAKGIRTGDDD